MTKHSIDDLFEQRLGGHEIQPSPAAWSKLEKQLGQNRKKRGVVFWLSIAASILVIITFGWLTLQEDSNTTEQPKIAQTVQLPPKTTVDTAANTHDSSSLAEEKKEHQLQNHTLDKRSLPPSYKPASKKTPVRKQPKAPVLIIEQESNIAENKTEETTTEELIADINDTNNTAEISVENTTPIASSQVAADKGTVRLVYTLKPAVPHQNTEKEEETEKVKSNPFKKALAFAKGIKENPKGIGSLREAKNNFLNLSKKKNDSK